jgi:hypothetical protein
MLLAACGMIASAATAGNELPPLLAPASIGGVAAFFTSSHAAKTRLRECAQASDSAKVRMMGESGRIAFNGRCRTLALGLVRHNPTMAYAWCVAAAASAEMEDKQAFESQLLECQRTSPYELWLSAMRFDLAFAHGALYEPALRSAVVSDMANLLGSHRGRHIVARASVGEPLLLALVAAAQQRSTPQERSQFEAALGKARGRTP